MMRKLFNSVRKEWLILTRDIEGMALLYIMPLVLVFLMPLLQEKSYQNVNEQNIDIVIIDNDTDSVGAIVTRGIEKSGIFNLNVIKNIDTNEIPKIKEEVATGKYQLGIYIPEGTTKTLKAKVLGLIKKQIPSINIKSPERDIKVNLFFDPTTKDSFRSIVKSSLNQFYSKMESRVIFVTYSKVLDALTGQITDVEFPEEPVIKFEEEYISEFNEGQAPNSVQHNVPAWTLFAMFFICIPLAGNIIRERDWGFSERLQMMPVNYLVIMSGKIIVYLFVNFVQAVIIILAGLYVLPLIGLPELNLGHSYAGFILMTITASLAATSYGIAIGSFAKTFIQSSVFGSVSVVIFAAIGGVWIPPYVMSDFMRKLSYLSPMRWGIEGYYEFFIRDASFASIYPHALKLLGFSILMTAVIVGFRKLKNR